MLSNLKVLIGSKNVSIFLVFGIAIPAAVSMNPGLHALFSMIFVLVLALALRWVARLEGFAQGRKSL